MLKKPLCMLLLVVLGCTNDAPQPLDGGADVNGDAAMDGDLPRVVADAELADAELDDSDVSSDDADLDSGLGIEDEAGQDAEAASDSALGDDSSTTPDGGEGGVAPTGECVSCAGTEKLCSGVCVANNQPAFGCGGSCSPCTLPHVLPTCTAQGVCAVAGCEPGWADCDHVASNGCEADLTSPATCGGCEAANRCTPPSGLCSPGGCVAACSPPLTRCGDSCVDLVTSPSNCGACRAPCGDSSLRNGFPLCQGGQCASPSCFAGFSLCSGRCVDLATDSIHCGSCGNACPYVAKQTAACEQSLCDAQCELGWTRCGSACTSTTSDPANCGGCGLLCGNGEQCVAGQCVQPSAFALASGLPRPADIVTDSLNVYWTDTSNGSVNSISKSGGPVVTIASSQARPVRIAVDDGFVYWSNNLGGAIYRAQKDGTGDPQLVVAATSPDSFILHEGDLYFKQGTAIARVSKQGGSSSTFATMPSGIVEIVSDNEAIFAMVTRPQDGFSHQLVRVNFSDASQATIVAFVNNNTGAIAVDSSSVYYKTGGTTGAITIVNKQSGEYQGGFETLYEGQSGFYIRAQTILVASCGLLWAGSGDTLYQQRVGARYPTKIVAGGINRAVVDGGFVYWTDTTGYVGKVALPD